MYSTFFFTLLISAAFGKQVLVQNEKNVALTLSVSNQDDQKVLPHSLVNLTLPEEWQGGISACAEICDGPRTLVELTLSANGDFYDVSLINGFNVPIKVIPIERQNCRAAICGANINKVCPEENQVTNSLGEVEACKHSPLIFQTLCPRAVISPEDNTNVLTCNATSYRIVIY
ncbi:uncharacterized protein LOC109609283 [Aethina tumida]|uniref:uncharacterized protein LOC109609283 n=1 Tax=Aethina tumida TaxID=116153 RepID=UPI00096B4403|nr:uncharacterized protein LOC109609283 [Aethina tumida]